MRQTETEDERKKRINEIEVKKIIRQLQNLYPDKTFEIRPYTEPDGNCW